MTPLIFWTIVALAITLLIALAWRTSDDQPPRVHCLDDTEKQIMRERNR